MGTTELDSHDNMVVIGAQGTIIQKTGRYAYVNAFSSDVGTLSRVPIVDAAVAYDCSFSGRKLLMVARNDLYVESMDHNLVPPFIMREAGLEVEERANIHTPQPSKEQHSIYCREIDLRIPFNIEGIFRCSKRSDSMRLRLPKLGSMISYLSHQMQIPGTQIMKPGGIKRI